MDKFEAYSFLFFDQLMGTLVLPPHFPFVLETMQIFSGYDSQWMWLAGTFGSLTGIMLTWILGYIIGAVAFKSWLSEGQKEKWQKLRIRLIPFAPWCLLIGGWVPFLGSILALAAGGLHTSFLRSAIPLFTTIGIHLFMLISYINLPL